MNNLLKGKGWGGGFGKEKGQKQIDEAKGRRLLHLWMNLGETEVIYLFYFFCINLVLHA